MKEIRFMAEWEECGAILLSLPAHHTDWDYMLETIHDQYRRMIRDFVSTGHKVIVLVPSEVYGEDILGELNTEYNKRIIMVETAYNDTWTRDYGFLSVMRNGRPRALDFGFNGWGLKFASDKDNLVNLHLREQGIIQDDTYRNERDFELEGGSVDTDGRGTILTTSKCLQSPNRNGGKSKEELNEILKERLGAEHVLWLDYGGLEGDDTDSHIDTLCRMAPHDTILFTGCHDMEDTQFEELLRMRAQLSLFRTMEGEPYTLLELPLPNPVYDEEGNRLPATYANYLVTPTHLFMPQYGDNEKDELACNIVKIAFPDKIVVPVECTALLYQHGSLHCATMQLPESIIETEGI